MTPLTSACRHLGAHNIIGINYSEVHKGISDPIENRSLMRSLRTLLTQNASLSAIVIWLGLVGAAVALGPSRNVPPPGFDILSYISKAAAFWSAVDQGLPFDPFAIPPTFRPPGTILLSYPFGYSPDLRWFFFRSIYFPVVLLAAAVYIASAPHGRSVKYHLVVGGLALSLAGMPILYQFQFNEWVPSLITWGMVDNFLAGVAAITMAAAIRAFQQRSFPWAALALAASILCLLIKPTGLLIIGLTGLTFITLAGHVFGWRPATFEISRHVALKLAIGAIAYVVLTALIAASEYFSASNFAYGREALATLTSNQMATYFAGSVREFIRLSFGFIVPTLTALGLTAGARDRAYLGFGVVGALCILVGVWWLHQSHVSQIRYLLPFLSMAFVAVVPALLDVATRMRAAFLAVAIFAAALPTVVTTALLGMPKPPVRWQAALGINLLSNSYEAETRQARDLLHALDGSGVRDVNVYIVDFLNPMHAFSQALEYASFSDAMLPRVHLGLSVNWWRPSAVRVNELLEADYLAFTPIRDDEERAEVLSMHSAPDFRAELLLMRAWLTTLSEDSGVSTVSETGARLVRISNRDLFAQALQGLEGAYTFPPAHVTANTRRFWSTSELSSLPGKFTPIGFHAASTLTTGHPAYTVRHASVTPEGMGLKADFWIENGQSLTQAGDGWQLFVQLLDKDQSLREGRALPIPNARPAPPDRPVTHYQVVFADRHASTLIGFGFYRSFGQAKEFLDADGGARDWDGQRVIMPLPTP